jgi:hypothetical protein
VGVVGNIGDFGDGDVAVTLTGDDGNDSFLAAAPGPVTIQAGAGNDRVDGGGAGTGRETISLGDGDDRLVSSVSDFIQGEASATSSTAGSGGTPWTSRGRSLPRASPSPRATGTSSLITGGIGSTRTTSKTSRGRASVDSTAVTRSP